MPFGERKKYILENPLSSVLSQFKLITPPENLKFNYLGIFKSLKLRVSMEEKPFNFSLTKFHSKYFMGCMGSPYLIS